MVNCGYVCFVGITFPIRNLPVLTVYNRIYLDKLEIRGQKYDVYSVLRWMLNGGYVIVYFIDITFL